MVRNISLQEIIVDIRSRNRQVSPNELGVLSEEARAEFYRREGRPLDDRSGAIVWEELNESGEEIGRKWQSPLTSAELLSEMRQSEHDGDSLGLSGHSRDAN